MLQKLDEMTPVFVVAAVNLKSAVEKMRKASLSSSFLSILEQSRAEQD